VYEITAYTGHALYTVTAYVQWCYAPVCGLINVGQAFLPVYCIYARKNRQARCLSLQVKLLT